MNNRLSAIVNIVPNNPPSRAIIVVSTSFISSHTLGITSSAGTVKMIPAAKDSPALAIVWTALFSRIVTFLKSERKIIMDITAAGILADTVIPAYKPR